MRMVWPNVLCFWGLHGWFWEYPQCWRISRAFKFEHIWIKSSPCKSIGNAKKTLCRIMWVFALDSREYARWVANLCPERLRDFRKESCWHRIQSKLILLDPTKMNYCTHFNLRPHFWLRANLHQHASACIIHLWPCGLDWNSLLHPNLALSGRGIYL